MLVRPDMQPVAVELRGLAEVALPGRLVDPEAGLLLRKATGERHTGQDVLTRDTPEYDTIASWISGLKP